MAKFGSYFGLCPLIDHRSLLGVTTDSDNGNVLVTLGKNIAVQYRLADQKQIFSWTTKEKFTSPVIFDVEMKKYVAVFNQMYIKSWGPEHINIDKLKKLKFNMNIDSLIVVENTSFVIFSNGAVTRLDKALSNHKRIDDPGFLEDKEFILDVKSSFLNGKKYIGLLIGNSTSNKTFNLIAFAFDTQGNRRVFPKVNLKNKYENLIGSSFHVFDDQIELLTLWSDGKLYVKSLENNSNDRNEMYAVIESVSCKDKVSLVSLDKDYIALYGGNRNQEGALLVIYNMQFKVTQCQQPFKLLTVGAKLWPVLKNIILPVGQNLAVVPYHLEKEQLCALVGSHKVNQITENKDVLIVQHLEEANWSNIRKKERNADVKQKVEFEVIAEEYLNQGYPESAIFQEVLPQYIETNNIISLEKMIYIFDDIPEKYFVEVLQYFLEAPDEIFENIEPLCSDLYPDCLQPCKRYEILTMILRKPINDIFILPYLRVKLNLDNILKLLEFISFLLTDDRFIDIDFMFKLIEWINLIFDAHYQSLLLSRDENIVKMLLSLSEVVSNELSHQEDLQKLVSIADQVSRKKKIKTIDKEYIVEKIELNV
ncbi:hypothetical protein WA026_020323 [Henosepilachna vigintioctopunctata]|uniref:Nucleolar protein 11 n=1 Tax=Henosepilachna vigintioctopunctata TaxID=420089 RepID=A0AAW1TYM8_9CUCU